MLLCLELLLLSAALVVSQDCGTHSNGDRYAVSACSVQYYECVSGQELERFCAPGTVYDPSIGSCTFPSLVPACQSVVIVGCHDENGGPVSGFSYTKSADCDAGTYYTCVDGAEIQKQCPAGYIYDKSLKNCNIGSAVPDCAATSMDSEQASPDISRTTTSSGPISTKSPSIVDDDELPPSDDDLTDTVTKSTTATTKSTTKTMSTKQPIPSPKEITTTPKPTDCGTHSNGDLYAVSACSVQYYECVSGQELKRDCPAGTAFDPNIGRCISPSQVTACQSVVIVDCHDENGSPVSGFSYTKSADCDAGSYYTCVNGAEIQKQCAAGHIYDKSTKNCNIASAVPDCAADSMNSDDKQPPSDDDLTDTVTKSTAATTKSTTKATSTKQPIPSTKEMTTTPKPAEQTSPDISRTTTSSGPIFIKTTSIVVDDEQPPPDDDVTNTVTKSTIAITATERISTKQPMSSTKEMTTTTTTTPKPAGKTYVGFVVDDTGSMSNEIEAVQQWISGCVSGTNSKCGQPPTGGWIITSYNDPWVGRVVGPTMDTNAIIAESSSYYATGGGDCPEMAFTGLQNVGNAVPSANGGCKIYFFTDATPKDYSKNSTVTELYASKSCAFIPILTGCCGPCPDACESTDPEYCGNHLTDHTATSSFTRSKRTTTNEIQTMFYTMSEATGGNIYVTDKPSSPEEMLEFLDEEVTLGFCTSGEIAGPSPDGYKCEADCESMNMCWDRSVNKCYCNTTCATAPIQQGYSKCPGEQVVVCDEDGSLQIIPDQKNCTGYYECYNGAPYHFSCADGSVFSSESPSYCDFSENVAPPCGTRGVISASP